VLLLPARGLITQNEGINSSRINRDEITYRKNPESLPPSRGGLKSNNSLENTNSYLR